MDTPEHLQRLLDGVDGVATPYGRYWHGYLVWLKPLLLVCGLPGIRVLNLILQTLMIVLVACLFWRQCRPLLLPYLVSLCLLPFWLSAWSLQYSSCFYIMNLGLLLVLWRYEKLVARNRFGYLFLVLGILTSYFDFLTYPLLTFLMPLVVVLFMQRTQPQNWRTQMLLLGKLGFFWGFGYGGFWLIKWLLPLVFLGDHTLLVDAGRELVFRLKGQLSTHTVNEIWYLHNGVLGAFNQGWWADFLPLASLVRNAMFFFCNADNCLLICAVCIMGIAYLWWCLRYQLRGWCCCVQTSWPYWVVMAAPYLWYLLVANHSLLLAFFTYKLQVATVFAGMAWFLSCVQKVPKVAAPLPPRLTFAQARIAVLIPCYNEALTIAQVVQAYHQALPTAAIYVYDNNSTDNSVALATQAGAIVRHVPTPGKGQVVRAMFQQIDADCYLMVDGDGTYQADCARALCLPILERQAEMVVGSRAKIQGTRSTHCLRESRCRQLF